jgi:hypothetical protein
MARVGLAATIACAPVTSALAQPTPARQNDQQGQTGAQRQPTPGRLTVPITGTFGALSPPTISTREGSAVAPDVTGTFTIQRFARTTDDGVAAVGTLTLSLADSSSSSARTVITQVAMSMARPGDAVAGDGAGPEPIGAAVAPAAEPLTRACEALSLVLGPLDLAMAGATVRVHQVNVDLAVVPGVGERLRDMLCQVTALMDGAARPADLVQALNALLDTLG